MKPAQIVAAGKKYVADAVQRYISDNPTPPGSKHKENKPPPSFERKAVNEFLGAYNLHEAFVEAILHDESK